jgi:signal peptidase I
VEEAQPAVRREPWLAANLSLVLPGLGHFHAGRRALGVWCIVAFAVLSAAAFASFLSPEGSTWSGIVVVSLLLLLRVLAAVDAHRRVRLANDVRFESERRSNKDPWLAVFLSLWLLPGAGHLYLGRRLRGVLFVLTAIVLATSRFDSPFWAVLGCFAGLDAYRSAQVGRDAPMKPLLSVVHLAALVTGVSLVTLVTVAVLRIRVVQAFRQPSEAMLPTLRRGDYFFVWKSPSYVPGRGDVVVFSYPPDPKVDYAKRIVGLPGDTLEIRKRVPYANGLRLSDSRAVHLDPRLQPAAESARDEFGPVVLGPGEYFVMGDNRENSNDSRYWGSVRRDLIRGRAFKIYWPPGRAGPIR